MAARDRHVANYDYLQLRELPELRGHLATEVVAPKHQPAPQVRKHADLRRQRARNVVALQVELPQLRQRAHLRRQGPVQPRSCTLLVLVLVVVAVAVAVAPPPRIREDEPVFEQRQLPDFAGELPLPAPGLSRTSEPVRPRRLRAASGRGRPSPRCPRPRAAPSAVPPGPRSASAGFRDVVLLHSHAGEDAEAAQLRREASYTPWPGGILRRSIDVTESFAYFSRKGSASEVAVEVRRPLHVRVRNGLDDAARLLRAGAQDNQDLQLLPHLNH